MGKRVGFALIIMSIICLCCATVVFGEASFKIETDVQTPVVIPKPVAFTVYDGDNPIDLAKYTVDWYMTDGEGDNKIASGVTLTLTYTTEDNLIDGSGELKYPIFARVTENVNSAETNVPVDPYATEIGAEYPLVVIDKQPVLRGQTKSGVSLSADGSTVTLNGMNIQGFSEKEDPFTTPCLFIWANSDVDIKVVGENSIQADEGIAAYVGFVKNDTERHSYNLNITGGTLNIKTQAGNGFNVYASQADPLNFAHVTLNDARMNIESIHYPLEELKVSGNAVYILSGQLLLYNSKLSAKSDDVVSVWIGGDDDYYSSDPGQDQTALYVDPRSTLTAENIFRFPQNPEQGAESTSAIVITGHVDINGGVVDIINHTKYGASEDGNNGLTAKFGKTTVRNNGTLRVSMPPSTISPEDVGDGFAIGLVSKVFVIDHAYVDIDIRYDANNASASHGMMFAESITIANGANVRLNQVSDFPDGIHYGGPLNATETQGAVNVNDANLTISATDYNNVDDPYLLAAGIFAGRLNVHLTNPRYAVDVTTTRPNGEILALMMLKVPQAKAPIQYTPGYVAERIALSGAAKFMHPTGNDINMFSYQEGPVAAFDTWLQTETVYGDDETFPARSVRIGVAGGEESGGYSSADDGASLPRTGDSSPLMLFMLLFVLSSVAMIALRRWARR